MHFRGILTPLAIGATLSLFTQGTFACSPNCSSEGCTVVDDPEQYSFNANAASRAAGSASDCEDIYNSWPTGEDPFSEETWEGGDCELLIAQTYTRISWKLTTFPEL